MPSSGVALTGLDQVRPRSRDAVTTMSECADPGLCVGNATYRASPRGAIATVGPLLGLTPPGSAMAADSAPRWTGAAKLRPPSVEQTATVWPVRSPDESCLVVQSQTAHTRPAGPAANWGPALTSEGVPASLRILRGGSKLSPPLVERVRSRAVCEAPEPQAT